MSPPASDTDDPPSHDAGRQRRTTRSLAVVVVVALGYLGLASTIAPPASAAPLTNAAWSLSKTTTGATTVSYTFTFTTVSVATLTKITASVPAGTSGTPTLGTLTGVGTGTVSLASNTLTFAITTPASIGAGTAIRITFDALTNTAAVGRYTSTVTTTDAGGTVDSGATSNMVIIGGTSYTAYEGAFATNIVRAIDLGTNVIGASSATGNPSCIAITPDGATAYVCNYYASTVTPITLATMAAGTPITVGATPFAIAITPDGTTAYVANFGSNSVTPITIASNTAGTAIAVGASPQAIAITPDGTKAYVGNYNAGTVTPITIASNTAGTAIAVGTNPQAIAITPDGTTAYVVNHGSDTMTPITVASNTAAPR